MEIKPTEKEPIYAPENKYGYKINVNHPVSGFCMTDIKSGKVLR